MAKEGRGLELLGSVLAVSGWSLAGVALVLGVLAMAGDADVLLVLFPLVGWLLSSLALAGLGHLLRAVAQLGRNVGRLGRMLAER